MSKVTEAQIKEWKKQYGELYEISVKNPDLGDKRGYFRSAKRTEVSAFLAHKDEVESRELLANSCFLGGDRELLDDDNYFISAMPQYVALLAMKESSLKKL